MHTDYVDYYWENGIPVGIRGGLSSKTYKIISDPYRKHFSIEEYHDTVFSSLIYDSRLLDFRQLKPVEQVGWEKIPTSETTNFIRDHHGRVAYLEEHTFEQRLPRTCHLYSPHRILLSINRVYYSSLGDSFNGIILYDANQHPIVKKTYECRDGEFTTLLSESWNNIENLTAKSAK